MIDVGSVIIGAVLGAAFASSLYEISLRKKINRMLSIMKRADQVQKDMDELERKINERKGGRK
jgi:hypothetical protein